MECPKCGHEQNSTIECEKCGIIFEKYAKQQERLREKDLSGQPTVMESGSRGFLLPVLCAVFAIVLFSYIYNHYLSPEEPQHTDTLIIQTSTDGGIKESKAPLTGISKQLNDAYPPGNLVEKARNATVFIKTAGGIGSGFIIDSSCHIVTNRHVVEVDENQIEAFSQVVDQLKESIAQEEHIIKNARNKLSNASDYQYKSQLRDRIEKREERLEDMKSKYEEFSSSLNDIQYGFAGKEYEVTLIDGSEFSVYGAETSDEHDLALLQLSAENCPFIEPAKSSIMDQGEQVFTIGNPAGFRYTVTSGIISGYRKMMGDKYIQTDASISPGNSGGPLINKDGQVIGVNTMISTEALNIGFAIPIETVLSEFKRSIE